MLVEALSRLSAFGAGTIALSVMVLAVTHVTSGFRRRAVMAAIYISRELLLIIGTGILSHPFWYVGSRQAEPAA